VFGFLVFRVARAASIVAIVGMSATCIGASAGVPPLCGLREVPHECVQLHGGFWGRRLKTHHAVTIPHALDCLEKAGHVTNFDKAAGVFGGPLQGHHAFDSDVHKALEGALYTLRHYEAPKLLSRVESIVDRILAAQREDGFLISCYIVKDSDKRWENLRLEHQLYNAGHFFEMAVEHQRLTGQDKALNAARRFADHIDGIFGHGKRYDVGGHEEVELALIKLYRATGERRYLELSRFFVDERGHAHGTERRPFDPQSVSTSVPSFDELPPGERRRARRRARNSIRNGRMQDHKPLAEQDAIGHAVRAGYIYSAMADIARFMKAPEYEKACERIWKDVVYRKMYITGGIGTAQYHDEGFGDPYLLPNRSYCESCAAIAHVLWQHRMALLKGEAKYADVMELVLYNGAISGIALSGDAFFYQNPLAGRGAKRRTWIGLACCPTNLARLIPQVGGFVYARAGRNVFVNLYLAGKATLELEGGGLVTLSQRTVYPWDGRVCLTVSPDEPRDFALCLRIPGWALGRPVPGDLYRFADVAAAPVTLRINGLSADASPEPDGYVHLERRWQAGDVVELNLPMEPRRVYAHENVEENHGKVALMRGPLVYCLEAVDHPGLDVCDITLASTAPLSAERRPELLGGVSVLRAKEAGTELTAVPYYAWANRDPGPMTVWIREGP